MPTTFAVPNTAGWDLDQLLPSESVVTGWKWDYGVTPLSDITVSIKTRCLPPPPSHVFFFLFFLTPFPWHVNVATLSQQTIDGCSSHRLYGVVLC